MVEPETGPISLLEKTRHRGHRIIVMILAEKHWPARLSPGGHQSAVRLDESLASHGSKRTLLELSLQIRLLASISTELEPPWEPKLARL